MKLEQLGYFIKIAKYQSMNIAAEKLHISQQALSLAVKALEKEFDAQLLERSRHGVKLTAAGKQVLDMAEDILLQVDKTKRLIQPNGNKKEGSILSGEMTCYINKGLNETFFPKVASRFYKIYPKVKLNIISGSNEEIIANINKGEDDIGLLNMLEIKGEVISPILPPTLQWVEIMDFHLMALVNKASALAHYQKISMSTFMKEPVSISAEYEEIEDYLLTKLLRYYGEPKIKEVNSSALSKQLVVDNQAVTIIPKNDTVNIVGGEQLIRIPFRNRFSIKVGYIYRVDSTLSPIVQNFIKLLPN